MVQRAKPEAMNTVKNNKLIAEFMGHELDTEENIYWIDDDNIGKYGFAPDELVYDTDWNWLMEVIRNITILEEFQDEYEFNEIFWDTFTQLDINDMHVQVVLFIKWYNENK